MGQTLSEPVVEKSSESGEDDRLVFGLSSMQGWRISMEDAHAAVLDLQKDGESKPTTADSRLSFFGVYDGHGGDKVAHFSGENVHKIIAKQAAFESGNFERALKDGFLATDKAILQDPRYDEEVSGCTASAALITGKQIYVANAGDSRTVLGVKGRAKPLSFDHKPQNEGERTRIIAAGGFVDFGRVNGNLALSRAIGDFEFKKGADLPPEQQIVTAFPDVTVHDIDPDDEFLVLACDGIWDCQSSQAVIEFIRRGIAEKQDLYRICENLMNTCLASSSETGGVGCDNMTIIIIGLLNGQTKEQWYETVAKRVEKGDGPCAPPEYAEFRAPGQRRKNFSLDSDSDDDDEYSEDKGIIRNTLRQGGRIIMLGDGSEVPTVSFSDDYDSSDDEFLNDDEKDEEALDKSDGSKDTEMKDAPGSSEKSEKPSDLKKDKTDKASDKSADAPSNTTAPPEGKKEDATV